MKTIEQLLLELEIAKREQDEAIEVLRQKAAVVDDIEARIMRIQYDQHGLKAGDKLMVNQSFRSEKAPYERNNARKFWEIGTVVEVDRVDAGVVYLVLGWEGTSVSYQTALSMKRTQSVFS